jgi:PAS domain S-box-containing protein
VAAFEQPARGANALQRSDDLQALFAATPVGLCYLDTELRFVFINEWLADINGLSVEQHVGRRIGEVIPDVAAGVESQFRQVIETGEPILEGTVVAETPAQPEVIRHFQHTYLPVKSHDGTVIGISCIVQDDSQRRRAAAALRESKTLYQSLVEHIPQMIFRKDLDGQVTFVNRRFCEFLQKPLNEILGRNDFDFHPRELAEKYRTDDRRVIETGETFEAVEEHRTTDGRQLIVRAVKTTIRDSIDRIIGVQGIFWDITDRVKMEEVLRASEERYRRLVKLMPVAVYTCDTEGRIASFNEQAATCWGRKPKIGDTDQRFCGSLRLYRPDGSFLPHDKTPMSMSLKEGGSFRDQEVTIERPGGAAHIHSANSSAGLISTSGSGSNWDSSKGGNFGSAAPSRVRCFRAAARPQ